MLCITKLGASIVIGYLVVECFVGDTSEASSRFGGFLKWGATTKYPKLDHFSIESHGDLGIPLFKKPPYDHEGWWILTLNQVLREPDPNRLNTGFHWGPREPPSWPSRKKRGFVAPNSWTHLDIPISPRFTDFFRGINPSAYAVCLHKTGGSYLVPNWNLPLIPNHQLAIGLILGRLYVGFKSIAKVVKQIKRVFLKCVLMFWKRQPPHLTIFPICFPCTLHSLAIKHPCRSRSSSPPREVRRRSELPTRLFVFFFWCLRRVAGGLKLGQSWETQNRPKSHSWY